MSTHDPNPNRVFATEDNRLGQCHEHMTASYVEVRLIGSSLL